MRETTGKNVETAAGNWPVSYFESPMIIWGDVTLPVALRCPSVNGQIRTSVKAGGKASERMRSSVAGVIDHPPVRRDISKCPASTDPADSSHTVGYISK